MLHSLGLVSFARRAKWFASSTPTRFGIACFYLFLFVLTSWAILHEATGGYGNTVGFPSPPSFYVPFLGRPSEWGYHHLATTIVGWTTLIATWMGIVTIAARNHFGQSDNKPHIADEPGKLANTENSPRAESIPNVITMSAAKYDATCPNCGQGVPSSATECRHCRTTYLGAYRPRIVKVSNDLLQTDANSAQAPKPSASCSSSSQGASRFKKIVKFCVIAAMAVVVGRFLAHAMYDAKKSKEQEQLKLTLNRNLQLLAAQTNKGLPSALNQSTRLDRVSSGSEMMTLSHTILNIAS
jgi:hypothetical protein